MKVKPTFHDATYGKKDRLERLSGFGPLILRTIVSLNLSLYAVIPYILPRPVAALHSLPCREGYARSHVYATTILTAGEVVNAWYEHGSMIPTTNKPFGRWAEILNDEAIATAALDRLLHLARVFSLKGDSYRMKIGIVNPVEPHQKADLSNNSCPTK